MLNVKISCTNFQTQLAVCRELFQNELNFVGNNFKKLRLIKKNATEFIERRKFDLRRKYSPTLFFKNEAKVEIFLEQRVSVKKMHFVLTEMDEDISLVQNQFDITYNDLVSLKRDLEEDLQQLEKLELVLNLLNYKIYEIQYNFMTTIDGLKSRRKNIEVSSGKESQIALALIELDKELADHENTHDSSFQVAKEEKLEAQEAYENIIGTLDDILDIIKKHYNSLTILLEAEKSLDQVQNQHILLIEEVEQELEVLTKKQTDGWKINTIQDLSEFPKGLKLTQAGLLLHESGKHVTYEEVQARRLLDYLDIFEHVKDEAILRDSNTKKSEGSSDRLSSEDVCYLKGQLGIPLTMALAEITTVQPRDPIQYLSHWLFKYRYNQEVGDVKRIELQQLIEERQGIAAKKWHSFVETEARAAVVDMIIRAEKEAIKNEYIRIEKEEMDPEEYEASLEDEARDKFDTYG